MRMLFPRSGRKPALKSGALCVLFAACLTGCASKNPLIDEPAVSRRDNAPASRTETAAAAPATRESDAAQGVQVSRDKPFLGFLRPYRPDIQQGNFVSQEMLSQVREGMTPDQVRFILGTPLLNDVFHANRWDYSFRMNKGNGEITSSRVTLIFEENRLARIEGGDLPTEADYLSRIAGGKPSAKNQTASPVQPAAPSSAPNPQSPASKP
jgi:outer membrane protein assembly factor BamE